MQYDDHWTYRIPENIEWFTEDQVGEKPNHTTTNSLVLRKSFNTLFNTPCRNLVSHAKSYLLDYYWNQLGNRVAEEQRGWINHTNPFIFIFIFIQLVSIGTNYAHKFALVRRTLFNIVAMSELHNKDDNLIPLRTFFMMITNNNINIDGDVNKEIKIWLQSTYIQ